MRMISKRFGAVSALSDVNLDVYPGEVVALVGDNGAGKSTLIKILAGVHALDEGSITFAGKDVDIHNPHDSLEAGIATVFQDLALCDNLDVVSNLFLGREIRPGRLDEITMELRAWELLRELSAKIPSVRIPVASLLGNHNSSCSTNPQLLWGLNRLLRF
jgi:simple sugar transport system ATP-binding protein/D-xylose transport system ATP-binding protein